ETDEVVLIVGIPDAEAELAGDDAARGRAPNLATRVGAGELDVVALVVGGVGDGLEDAVLDVRGDPNRTHRHRTDVGHSPVAGRAIAGHDIAEVLDVLEVVE